MNSDWTCHLPLLADIGDFAYVIAMLIFGLVSLIAKKVSKDKEGQEGSGAEEFLEPAELVEEEPARHEPPPIPSQRGGMAPTPRREFGQPTPPPIARPSAQPPATVTRQPVMQVPAARLQRSAPVARVATVERTVRPAAAPAKPAAEQPEEAPAIVEYDAYDRGHREDDTDMTITLGIFAQHPSDLRRVIVLSEILAPPVAVRESTTGSGPAGLWD